MLILLSLSAYFNNLVALLQLPAADVKIPVSFGNSNKRTRREYHGDASRPVLDRELVYDWITEYNEVAARMPSMCTQVIDRFEEQVALFGYSLKSLRKVTPTPFIAEFMHESLVDTTSSASSRE